MSRILFFFTTLLLTSNCLANELAQPPWEYDGIVIGLVLIILVLGSMLFVVWNSKKRPEHKPENTPLLQTTKQQLVREIARHEQTEELLRETQEYLDCVINSMPTVLIGVTPDGYITHWNHSAEKIAGLSSEEAIGSHINQSFPDLPASVADIAETIRSGIPFNRGNIRDGVGSEATYTNLTIYPLLSTELSGAVILAEDVTPRVRMENLLIQNEKMLSLGELAAGVAHEINNPLAGILSNTQNISRRVSAGLSANNAAAKKLNVSLSDVENYLNERGIFAFLDNIRNSGERAADIVKNLLEFSRGNDRNHVATDLAALLQNTLDLASNTFEIMPDSNSSMPSLNLSIETKLDTIGCAPSEIQQVILNIIRNAVQAIAGAKETKEGVININVSQNEKHIVINISDNGPGIEEKVLKHIFEPFYTTKDVGQGTGLGLSVSYFIIREHHQGDLDVESAPGKGTTFKIKLPKGELIKAPHTDHSNMLEH